MGQEKALYMETTKIPAEKTAGEILSAVVTAGATQVATEVPAQIQVSWEYGNSLKLSDKEQAELKTALNGESLCPRLYWFEDTPRVREILKVVAE